MQYFISFYDNAVVQLDVLFFMAGLCTVVYFHHYLSHPLTILREIATQEKTSSKKRMIFRCQKLGIQIKKAHFSKKYI